MEAGNEKGLDNCIPSSNVRAVSTSEKDIVSTKLTQLTLLISTTLLNTKTLVLVHQAVIELNLGDFGLRLMVVFYTEPYLEHKGDMLHHEVWQSVNKTTERIPSLSMWTLKNSPQPSSPPHSCYAGFLNVCILGSLSSILKKILSIPQRTHWIDIALIYPFSLVHVQRPFHA